MTTPTRYWSETDALRERVGRAEEQLAALRDLVRELLALREASEQLALDVEGFPTPGQEAAYDELVEALACAFDQLAAAIGYPAKEAA